MAYCVEKSLQFALIVHSTRSYADRMTLDRELQAAHIDARMGRATRTRINHIGPNHPWRASVGSVGCEEVGLKRQGLAWELGLLSWEGSMRLPLDT